MAGVVLDGDFGTSIRYQRPVFDVLFRAMPWSVFLSVYGLMFGITATVLVGVLMAWHEGTVVDKGGTVLAFQWGLFPSGGHSPRAAQPGFSPEFMLGIL